MTESSQLTKLAGSTKKLGQLISKASNERKTIVRDMRSLKAKGLIYASLHWRERRYLYLLYPLVPGEPRKREYIGTDPARIEAAQQAIGRAGEYDRLNDRLHTLDAAILRASQAIGSAVTELQKW